MVMKCWSCGHELSEPLGGQIGFRETCERCGAALHCCLNCKYFKRGLPNDCAVPGTEYIADWSASNLCDEFKLLGQGPENKNNNQDHRKRFDSLFRD